MAGIVKPRKKGKSRTSKTIEFLRQHKTECLIALVAIAALGLVALEWFDYLTTSFTVRDSASEFAQVLREARAISSERHATITVAAASATTWRGCIARVLQGQVELTSLELPNGVSTDGTVTFSPYGIPAAARNFVVRKADCALTVVVNEHGLITIPAP